MAFVPSSRVHHATQLEMSSEPLMDNRRSFVTKAGSVAAAAALATTSGVAAPLPASAAASRMWTPVDLPFTDTLYDIDFDT
eukprot:scaffold24768_cov215-Cylindrotheca_fusiformis.AAC.3